ncbi:DUF6414 family protein [Kocuria palustris]|uniref:DUF6414 family protein n=1 Tax=Kocuria palustris TaxID=71999 RepID=UPI0033348258
MLHNSQYLDEDALANYIAALEGGLRDTGTSRTTGSHGYGGSIGWNSTKFEGSKDAETESTLNLVDHKASRLRRLIEAGHKNPEDTGWVEVLQPDTDFAEIGTGAIIEWECDVFVPESIAPMANHAGLSSALQTMKGLQPSAEALGLDMKGVPTIPEMDAMTSFLDQLDVALVVVGDDSDTDWKLVGSLDKRWIAGEASFDGRVRVIGKVKKKIAADRWYPMVSLPGMNLVNRDERRRLERNGPKNESEKDQFVRGPALVLDYLAIFS